jgi:hypothetical protein
MLAYAIRRLLLVVIITVTATVFPSWAAAQSSPGQGRFVTGPLAWTPTFQLHEAGVDSNVFNSPINPKEDVTAGALSQVNSLLTLGLLEATTSGSLEYLYFDRYSQERGLNRRVATHLEFPLSRFSPDVTVAWNRVKERSGNEIDTRTPRTDFSYAAGIQTRVGSRVALSATAGKQKQTYDRGFTFQDTEIAEQLNRESTLGTVSGRVTVTPLTVFAAQASVGRDTFPLTPDADTDNLRVDAGFEFAPDAVIRGRASIGYHSMQPHRSVSNAVAANFSGVTSSVDLSYTLLEFTRFTGRFSRDSSYSVETNQPYYVSTAGAIEILQTLFGPVDLTIRAARERLDYPATDLEAAHLDVADTFGGGPSIRVGPQTVIALVYDSSQRRSPRGPEFGYQRRRIYTTLTYEF